MNYDGIDGFLGTRASLMLDLVFLAMFLVLPVLAWSVWLVRYRRNYLLHKRVQVTLGIVLLLAVTAFEVDMRSSGWEHRAVESPYHGTWAWGAWGAVQASLAVHLPFAVSTAVLWAATIVLALRRFPCPPAPCAHSRLHRVLGRLSALDLLLTSTTGWIFYWLAFAA